MAIETLKPSIQLRHFSIKEGSSFLRERLRQRVARPLSNPSEEETQLTKNTSSLKSADRTIEAVIATAFPQARNRAGLLNETGLLAPDPERALRIIDANGSVDTRLKFEMVRKMLLAGIAGSLEERSLAYQMRSELHDVHALLDERLFRSGKIGQTWETTTYAVHKSGPNEVQSVHEVYPWFVKPGTHVKKFVQQSRYVEDVGFVISNLREKSRESSIIKTVRRAVQERAKSGRDDLDALDAVKDSMGLMFVVKGTMKSDEARVNALRDKVLTLLQERYGEIEVVKQNENGNRKHSAEANHADYQRVKVQVASLPVPLELMFYGEGAYINDSYNVGKRDKVTRRYTGNAHRLYEINRIRQILPVLFPEEIEGEEIRGYKGLADETVRTMSTEARKLKREKKVLIGQRLAERVKSRRAYTEQISSLP